MLCIENVQRPCVDHPDNFDKKWATCQKFPDRKDIKGWTNSDNFFVVRHQLNPPSDFWDSHLEKTIFTIGKRVVLYYCITLLTSYFLLQFWVILVSNKMLSSM
jgi:hypothetical protein